MHVSELDTEEQRQSLQRAMATVRAMNDDERMAIIEHAVAASIYYAGTQKVEVLHDWARGLLGTLRSNGSRTYRQAIAQRCRATFSGDGASAKDLLAALRR